MIRSAALARRNTVHPSVALLGFLLVGTLVVFIADALGFCLFGCPPSVVAPAAASEAAVSPVQTKPVVNKLVERVTTTVNAVKARTSAAPIPRTVRPKPLSSAVKGGPVVGKPQVSRHAPSGHSGLLRTAVRSRTSNLSNAVKHAIGTTRKKVQNSLSRIAVNIPRGLSRPRSSVITAILKVLCANRIRHTLILRSPGRIDPGDAPKAPEPEDLPEQAANGLRDAYCGTHCGRNQRRRRLPEKAAINP